MKIPNKEIKSEFEMAIEKMSDYKNVSLALNKSKELLKATIKKDEKMVAHLIDQAHEGIPSLNNYNDENALSAVIDLAYYVNQDYYEVGKELPAGRGRTDIVYRPLIGVEDKPAMVVELKWNKPVESAITQIKKNTM